MTTTERNTVSNQSIKLYSIHRSLNKTLASIEDIYLRELLRMEMQDIMAVKLKLDKLLEHESTEA